MDSTSFGKFRMADFCEHGYQCSCNIAGTSIIIFLHVWSVTVGGFWIDDWIYWTFWYSAWLPFTVHCYTHTHTLTLTHSHSHTLTLTHSLTLSLSLSHTHTLSLSHTHSHTLSLTHSLSLVSTVMFSPLFLGSGFQQQTLPFLWVSELSLALATSFSQQQLTTAEPQQLSYSLTNSPANSVLTDWLLTCPA
jgi:hypothetical protein